METSDLPEAIPASTLILMKPGLSAPEILVMERAATMAFAAGALVFPGGRIEPQDESLAVGQQAPDAAARIAAIRETIEETGIAIGLLPQPDAELAALIRADLASHLPFETVLARHGLTLDLEALIPFARWCPNFRETRRFDTLFFLAQAPEEAGPASGDEAESVRAFWASAGDILKMVEAGRAHVIFPTRRNLERLARFGSFEEARADAERHPVRKITPWVEQRGETHWVCIPEDIGYPVTAELLETARRR
jgi:8-oxo-dGTP pyrophosphatase MutT (NUDIX family)